MHHDLYPVSSKQDASFTTNSESVTASTRATLVVHHKENFAYVSYPWVMMTAYIHEEVGVESESHQSWGPHTFISLSFSIVQKTRVTRGSCPKLCQFALSGASSVPGASKYPESQQQKQVRFDFRTRDMEKSGDADVYMDGKGKRSRLPNEWGPCMVNFEIDFGCPWQWRKNVRGICFNLELQLFSSRYRLDWSYLVRFGSV